MQPMQTHDFILQNGESHLLSLPEHWTEFYITVQKSITFLQNVH